MSIRQRLILAFATLVLLLIIVALVSAHINRGIHRRVAALARSSSMDVETRRFHGMTLEIEGYWDGGAFVATEFERLADPRRPKLRGTVAQVDPAAHTLVLYGIPIRVTAETEFEPGPTGPVSFDDVRVGDRAEISCQTENDGVWVARRIRLRDVKESDKIKGTITAVKTDGVFPDTLEMFGLPVVLVKAESVRDPRSQLHRIVVANQMLASVQDCLIAAQELAHAESPVEERRQTAIRLQASFASFQRMFAESQVAAESATDPTAGSDRFAQAEARDLAAFLEPLSSGHDEFRAHLDAFMALSEAGADSGEAYFRNSLGPFVRDELLPAIESYRADAEEDLASEVGAISTEANRTMRLVLFTSAVASVLAVVLGISTWRSLSLPIASLQKAADRIGAGHLDTRVDVVRPDELGSLATAFNHMAQQLSASMLSVGNLSNIIDSMSGALIIVDANGAITQVNRATVELLGYGADELRGRPFETVCPAPSVAIAPHDESSSAARVVGATSDGVVAVQERVLRRKNGVLLPVSFGGAALRSPGGAPGFVCIAQDLTERKRIEEQLRRSLSEKELLLREVHHRVKNNLQVMSSLIDLQMGQLTSDDEVKAFTDSQNRIRSIALIHEQLYRAAHLDRIDVRAYLELLAEHLLRSFGARAASIRLRTDVADEPLSIDEAMACGLIINELVTNAVKHAFDGRDDGEIAVSLSRGEGGAHVLTVADNGRGLARDFDIEVSASLGLTLVTSLVRQLNGSMSVEREHGVQVRIEFRSAPALQTAEA